MDKDYSQQGLQAFFEYAEKTGALPRNTVMSRRTATQKLLSVLHGDEGTDLRNVDVDEVAARFANRHKADYSAESLRVYQSRARSAINDFIAWVDNPTSFKPARRRGGGQAKSAQTTETPAKGSSGNDSAQSRAEEQSNSKTGRDTFNIPIPVRDGVMVEVIGLPRDLRPDEAQKISAVVAAYATKEEE